MTNRITLGRHDRSGPADRVGMLGSWPVARVWLDAGSGVWMHSCTWLGGIGAHGASGERDEAVRRAEETVSHWVDGAGLVEKQITVL